MLWYELMHDMPTLRHISDRTEPICSADSFTFNAFNGQCHYVAKE